MVHNYEISLESALEFEDSVEARAALIDEYYYALLGSAALEPVVVEES